MLTAVNAGWKAAKTVVPASVISKEGRANLVTACDSASEKSVSGIIKKYFPKVIILSKETQSSLSKNEFARIERL